MSIRGSFVSSRIFTRVDGEALASVLGRAEKHLHAEYIDSCGIVAGKWGGSYPGESELDFDDTFRAAIESVISSAVEIVVYECGPNEIPCVYRYEPKEKGSA